MHYSSGFVLGLSTGVVCLAYCGPVLIPYLMGEGNPVSRNMATVMLFLTGRLMAYLIVALVAGIIGNELLQPSLLKTALFGVLYILLAVLLIAYGFHRFKEVCLGHARLSAKNRYFLRWPFLLPVTGGFATGLNVCPPFLLAITGAMETGKLAGSVLFFLMFFLGTSVYFIPLPFIGFFRRKEVLRIVGKFAAIIAGIFYLYKGIILLVSL